MKKISLAAIIIIALSLSAVAATQLNIASANPLPGYEVPPDASTKPPTITITNTTVSGNNVTINYNAKVGESTSAHTTHVDNVSYTSDWNQYKIYVYPVYYPESQRWDKISKDVSRSAEITGIPDGTHTLTLYVDELGSYIINERLCPFHITSAVSINFTIDTVSPNVSILSLENKTYGSSDVPLSFSVNEETSSITYVLDDQDEVLIDGNTTLAGLSDGTHKITVYAFDVGGNVGVSETIAFTIAAFPVAPVAAASIAVASLGLLVYLKKRQKTKSTRKFYLN